MVGDIGHDQYVELHLAPGEHIVEACIGGVRYARPAGLVLEILTSGDGARVSAGPLPCAWPSRAARA